MADSFVDPTLLGQRSKTAALDECKKVFHEAIRRDGRCVEAYFYLALVHKYHANDLLSQFKKHPAEQNLRTKPSNNSKTPTSSGENGGAGGGAGPAGARAIYVSTWASFPLENENLAAAERGETAALREGALGGLPKPLGGSLDPLKEATRIEGDIEFSQGKYEQAIGKYTASLPQDLETVEWADYGLLLARARCRYFWGVSQGRSGQVDAALVQLEAAAQDADRAAKIGVFRNNRIYALDVALKARGDWCGLIRQKTLHSTPFTAAEAAKQPVYLSQAIEIARGLFTFAPRRPQQAEWHQIGANLRIQELYLGNPAGQSPEWIRANLLIFSEAVQWQEELVQLSAATGALQKIGGR